MNFQNLVDYSQYYNIDILGGVSVPAALDADTVKSHIMLRCGLLTPLYSEPETMRDAITHWFDYMQYGIAKMCELASTEYLPLENYRRTESETRTGSESEKMLSHDSELKNAKTQDDGGETITDSGTITDDLDGTTTDEVSAYNSDDYEPSSKRTVDQTNERELDTEREIERDNTRTHNEDNSLHHREDSARERTENIGRTVYGNIGTMTTQEMFTQELDLLQHFNPYDWIVDRLEKDLFLGLW